MLKCRRCKVKRADVIHDNMFVCPKCWIKFCYPFFIKQMRLSSTPRHELKLPTYNLEIRYD